MALQRVGSLFHSKEIRDLRILARLFASTVALAGLAWGGWCLQSQRDTCLMMMARNISKGEANFFVYYYFSNKRVRFAKGDVLEYDIFLHAKNPMPRGGIDADLDSQPDLRDRRLADQFGERAHGDADLLRAEGKWLTRKIALDAVTDSTARRWALNFEGNKEGTYVQFVDNVLVRHADGSATVIYDDGAPAIKVMGSREGYSQSVVLTPVTRDQIREGRDPSGLIDEMVKRQELRWKLDAARAEVEVAAKVANNTDDEHLKEHVREAQAALDKIDKDGTLTAEAIQAALHQVNQAINHEHPTMRRYTGHLVGHAHIDFQWLWEWPETLQVCKDTFGQAIKFMDEFPGFTFSQSSPALYQATEENFPDLFKKVQERVADGHWELVGGRVCEGDTNMISPESHARHFLYGQRYFRERFKGKDADVGWEPDTFGHAWTMPQILKLGGCKYYYFCRGGKNVPLFWWEGPDGTRILTFDEPATGSWYNSDLSYRQFDELFAFQKRYGSNDMLWVYGVGNHGGGPTREHITTALDWMKKGYLPTVKFSTATQFFRALEKYDMKNIPVVSTDLNGVFEGCYTTHSDIKRWNRDAEAITESAEAVAAYASLYGFDYPKKAFRLNWEEITWNHHHDTLPGTSIHPSYGKSEQMYQRSIASSREIAGRAMQFLGKKVKGHGAGVLVFNPTGHRRDDVVTVSAKGLPDGELTAVHPNGSFSPISRSAGGSSCSFLVSGVAPYGYRRYDIRPRSALPAGGMFVSLDTMENADYRLRLNSADGTVVSLVEKKSGQEFVSPGGSANRMEIFWENDRDRSAWTIGPIEKVDRLGGVTDWRIGENGPARVAIHFNRRFRDTVIAQTIELPATGAPEFSLATEWKELGKGGEPAPFLKVAFDLNVKEPTMTYDVPFGNITRPADKREYPAVTWVDISDAIGGAAVINDSKHGYSAEGSTLWLSLIRSTNNPDPRPNDRPQWARWTLLPHTGSWKQAGVVREANAFNRPLLSAVVTPAVGAALPAEGSLVSVDAPGIEITGVKIAEDDQDLIVRFYEAFGAPSRTAVRVALPVTRTASVNFMEDKISVEQRPVVQMRGYEIRTLKMAVRRPIRATTRR